MLQQSPPNPIELCTKYSETEKYSFSFGSKREILPHEEQSHRHAGS
jgi:hypothetical protein